MSSLPLYYKNSKPVGLSSSTIAKSWKDNYLLVVVFVGFVTLIAGTFWFLPPLEEKDTNYERTYGRFTGNSAAYITDPAIPSEPTLKPPEGTSVESVINIHRENVRAEDLVINIRKHEDDRKEDERDDEKERDPKVVVDLRVREEAKEVGLEVKPPVKLEAIIAKEEQQLRELEENENERREGERGVNVNPPQVDLVGLIEESRIAEQFPQMEGNGDILANRRLQSKDLENEERRRKVVEMAKHAWDGYVQYAWGQNELKPISRRGHSAVVFGKTTLGATIVDSLDTLYLMGLQDRFNQGKEWVRLSLNINEVRSEISVFEFNIRFIGGLLSAYALSNDEMFKNKAVEIADRLLPAFNTPSGIPKNLLNLATGAIKNWGWSSGGSSILAEFGSLHLEFQYLTYLTGDKKYLDKVEHIRHHLQQLAKNDGLYPNFLNPNTGQWGTKQISLGALGDSFYEYLLKSWLITSKDDVEARDMYYEAVDAIERHLIKRTRSGMIYVTDVRNGRPDGKMQHLTCFSGGMFALGASNAINGKSEHYMSLGEDVASVCHDSYQRTATKLGPEAFRFDSSDRMTSRNNEKMFLLRPETVETYFYLWRLTKDQKYRDWGWEVVQAIESQCRIETGGYTGIKDVYNENAPKDDVQQSFFIAETLKYLFLLFSDDSVLPLESWVLNTEAHPFPLIPGIPKEDPLSRLDEPPDNVV